MIKGAQKRMIVVKTNDSSVFEEAYFVLRRESLGKEDDMVREASRIIESGGGCNRKTVNRGWAFALAGIAMLFGGSVGCFLTGIIAALA